MIRTQIQFTEEQIRTLREMAAKERRSVADIVRECVDRRLGERAGAGPTELRRRARSALGRFRSGRGDLSEGHDKYLEEAFEA